jgi:hypothetical protein
MSGNYSFLAEDRKEVIGTTTRTMQGVTSSISLSEE